jgi:hypothetical protein
MTNRKWQMTNRDGHMTNGISRATFDICALPLDVSADEFRRVYYDRELDYWDIADTWGVERWVVDEWRRALGLPSRRYYGTYCRSHAADWRPPPAGAHRGVARRRGLPVRCPPRRVNGELYWLAK